MKFLIQKINKEVRHDFAFTLLESIRFDKWLHGKDSTMKYQFLNTIEVVEPSDIYPPFEFTHRHYYAKCVPIGSVDFVTEYLVHMYGLFPKPINVPEELFHYAGREIFNGNDQSFENSIGKFFFKSNDRIKGYSGYYDTGIPTKIPAGNYQISEFVHDINSEWRAFIYEGKLVGLQNYGGDFAKWPNTDIIKGMIGNYKSAPIAYTLDIGISDDRGTFVIECHDFFSVGLYGFADLKLLPHMFYKWFWEYIKKSK